MDASTKQIQVVGSAANEYQNGGSKTRKRSHRVQKGAGATSPGTLVQLASTHVPGSTDAAAAKPILEPAQPNAAIPVNPGIGPAPLEQSGGQDRKRVILSRKRKGGGAPNVILAPKKNVPAAPQPQSGGASHRKTRKAKRIHISLSGLSKKMTRAKKIRGDASSKSPEEIKKILQKAGLIKADSKAPESILRQMYVDFMTLKNRAL
jgi:hypothetical protein